MSMSSTVIPTADGVARQVWGPSWREVSMFLSQLADLPAGDVAQVVPQWVAESEQVTAQVSESLQSVFSQLGEMLSGKTAPTGDLLQSLRDQPAGVSPLVQRVKDQAYGPAATVAGAAQIASGVARSAGLVEAVERVQREVHRMCEEKGVSPAIIQWLSQVAVGYVTTAQCPAGAYSTAVRAALVDEWEEAMASYYVGRQVDEAVEGELADSVESVSKTGEGASGDDDEKTPKEEKGASSPTSEEASSEDVA